MLVAARAAATPQEHHILDSHFIALQSRIAIMSPMAPSNPPKSRLMLYSELPHWLQDNPFITSHYRPPSYSFKKCIASIWTLHNETVNVHTHMWGALAVVLGAFPVYQALSTRHASFTWQDTLAFGTWYICAFACLGLSAAYHALCNYSPNVSAFSQKLDHLGIVVMTCGSFLSMIYYGWYCEPEHAYVFAGMITTLSIACAALSLNPKTRTPAWRPYRAVMFTALGMSALIPITSGLLLHGIQGMNQRITLFPWLGIEFGCYLTGAILYARLQTRFPERISPGKFDVFGSSHQIFHVLIVCAAASHFKGLIMTFDWNHRLGTCADRMT
ncbi:hypothetical protein ANO11243_033590 [Dothideomycetidae sp. 11243]|nr:hypothetical protein ANO11243_033590 [fungal sp. No.11243]